jgi:hypothetical protein
VKNSAVGQVIVMRLRDQNKADVALAALMLASAIVCAGFEARNGPESGSAAAAGREGWKA